MRNSPGPGSLNYSVKRKEALKIDNENLRMAKKIVMQKPNISVERFHKDYKCMLKKQEMADLSR